MRATSFLLVTSTLVSLALAVACDALPDTCETTKTCTPSDAGSTTPEAGLDAAPAVEDAGSLEDASACEPGLPPSQGGCLKESEGYFVSPLGDDASVDGSRSEPFLTLERAAEAAKFNNKKRVFQCAGQYTNSQYISTSADGIAVYGGLDCITWKYTGAKAVVTSTDFRPALILAQLVEGIEIEDFEFRAIDASSPGTSSIAVQLVDAKNVTFRRVSFVAGRGADGRSPEREPQAASAASGTAASTSGLGGASCSNSCSSTSSVGGRGGDVGSNNSEAGLPNRGGTYPNNGARGAVASECNDPSTPGQGGNGALGMVGAEGPGAKKLGAIVADAWTPASGQPGGSGVLGQGGGGGGARGGAGGGGGCGGCGGSGGVGGGGGGASAAIEAIGSSFALYESQLRSAAGGNGGRGALGQAGQPGGGGAPGGTAVVGAFNGCAGGAGAVGGQGGPGGGGAGGVSAGVLHDGTTPQIDDATTKAISVGMPGQKGAGGEPGVNDGVIGIARALLDGTNL